jgi:hypothetical protein
LKTASLGDRWTASLNVDTDNLFDYIVDSRHSEVDIFLNLGCTVWKKMTCFLAVRTSPNMVGLTVKHIIIKNQLKQNFKVPGVLFSGLSQCGLAGVFRYWNMRR